MGGGVLAQGGSSAGGGGGDLIKKQTNASRGGGGGIIGWPFLVSHILAWDSELVFPKKKTSYGRTCS